MIKTVIAPIYNLDGVVKMNIKRKQKKGNGRRLFLEKYYAQRLK